MKHTILSALTAWMCVTAHAADAPTVAADRDVAKQLGMELKSALTAALQASPENAIGVCNDRAPSIAAKIGAQRNAQVGRTALRVRNPKNSPTEWQRAVLLDFQNRQKAGEPLATMEYSADIQTGDSIEHRYMKAIAVEPLCVTCHGAQLSSSLRDAIRAKYPSDAATGFNVGDLRGAVYVVHREMRTAK